MAHTFPLTAVVSVLISSVCLSSTAPCPSANLFPDPQNGFLSTSGYPTVNWNGDALKSSVTTIPQLQLLDSMLITVLRRIMYAISYHEVGQT